MPHVRERQPFPEDPTGSETTSGAANLQQDQPRSPGRVNADEAVTGTSDGSSGEAPPGGIPGDDGSLEGGDPA
jgi:hypothetical protein